MGGRVTKTSFGDPRKCHFYLVNTRTCSKRDVKIARLSVRGGGGGGGGGRQSSELSVGVLTFGFSNGDALLGENMPFFSYVYTLSWFP